MPNRYGDNDTQPNNNPTTSRQREVSPDPDNPNPDFNQDFNHPQAAITNCSLLRPLSAGIAALVAEAERLHGQIGRRRALTGLAAARQTRHNDYRCGSRRWIPKQSLTMYTVVSAANPQGRHS